MKNTLNLQFIYLVVIFCFSTQAFSTTTNLSDDCVKNLQTEAKNASLPDYLIDERIPQLQHLTRVIELDRSQPEFTDTYTSYIQKRITKKRIERGKTLLAQHQKFLEKLTREYGIPGRYLIAFWGLESNFGNYQGKIPILNSLATLSCDTRRSTFFIRELIAALKVLHNNSLAVNDMVGSWAGAIGHTQFMPSTYLRYAVDGDNDGSINLWKSEKDALTSSANYLNKIGWNSGELWGRQVIIPKSFDYRLTGYHNWKPLSFWKSKGISQKNKSKLADSEMQAALLVPAGHSGPAYLVYQNFKVIMLWNKSIHYALSVGILADRFINVDSLGMLQQAQPPLDKRTILKMQTKLNEYGFDAGKADGIIGTKTQLALQRFQASKELIADGFPHKDTLNQLFSEK